jgi:hypothetical protein
VRGVQLAAKGVGEAFTGGRDLHQLLHSLASTTVAVEAYFGQPCFDRILPPELKAWAKSLCGEAREAHERLRYLTTHPLRQTMTNAVNLVSLLYSSHTDGVVVDAAIESIGWRRKV